MRITRADVVRLAIPALLTSLLISVALLLTVHRGDDHIVSMIAPGASGHAASVFKTDFPDQVLPRGRGHDGQFFYAIARQPMHLRAVAPALDRPRYRLQRIVFPVLAWILHPNGGGRGLALAMNVITALGVALTGLGGALLARGLGASESATHRIALLFPLLPICLVSLDITCPDALALGLVLIALAADLDDRPALAIAAGTLAVLTRETALLVLVGWWITRGRRSAAVALVPTAAAAAWWAWLRITVPDHGAALGGQFDLRGLWIAASTWLHGHELLGATSFVVAVTLGVLALHRRGASGPLGPAIVIQLAFIALLITDVVGPNYNGPRAVGPLLALAIVALAAQPTSRNSRLSSWISSRSRAASSNRRSRAASCISSVRF